MSLSLDKLKEFLKQNGYFINRYFIKNNFCSFIEIITEKSAHSILLNIPSKYNFQYMNEKEFVFNLKKIKSKDRNDIEDYAFISETKIQETYNDVNIPHTFLPDDHTVPMSDHLNNTYKHHVILDELESKNYVQVKNIFRQLKRLRYSVHGISHKVAIFHSMFLGYLDQNDAIHIYEIENTTRTSKRKISIVVDFDIFYDKITILEEEINTIVKSIYSILNKNQKTHTRNIHFIMNNKEEIVKQSEDIMKRKDEYLALIDKYKKLLDELQVHEKTKMFELGQLEYNVSESFHSDMKRNYKKKMIETEIQKMQQTKSKLFNSIRELRELNEHITLSIDTILFDNIIMLDQIFNNFKLIEKLEREELEN